MQTADSNSRGLIGIFCNHPVAANLLRVMLLLAGVWGLNRLNTQFLPDFDIPAAVVVTTWRGASAGDAEDLLTIPLEQQLRNLDHLKEMTSKSREGVSSIVLQFEDDADLSLAVEQVKDRVDQTTTLPAAAETPEVTRATDYEPVASFLAAADHLGELRALARRFEAELLERGIARVVVSGLPAEMIAIEVPAAELRRLQLSLDDIGRRVEAWSQDVPVGIIGQADTSRQLRFRERRTRAPDFESVPVVTGEQGRLVTLGDIAAIARQPKDRQVTLRYRGRPAVNFTLQQTKNEDALDSAAIFHDWLNQTRPALPAGVEVVAYNEEWRLIRDRIDLLVKNGLGGLVLVVLILFLFMSARVAWWTAVSIPVSFMAALAALYLLGGSINMISLFGLIMTLGIIVDDSIVVGEEAMSQYERGTRPRVASEAAARRMLGPVCASSLTTAAAFLPLLLVGGVIGTIMQAIPTVVICVIIASLIECFLVLPGHLTHSFRRMGAYNPGRMRRGLDHAFETFRERGFRPAVGLAVAHRWSTVALAVALLIATAGWAASGRIGFQFFPQAETSGLFANISFVSGTPAGEVRAYMAEAERALRAVEREVDEAFVKVVVAQHGRTFGEFGEDRAGDHFAGLNVQLLDPDRRRTRNRDIIKAWRAKLPPRPNLESLTILEPFAGPPGQDLDLNVTGEDVGQVKLAAQALQDVLAGLAGVSGVGDDSPYGREQMVLRLTPTAEALGLNVDNVSRQLRAAYSGYELQALSDGYDDIDVRVLLPAAERGSLERLAMLPVLLPDGRPELIANLASIERERGFDIIRHADGKLAVTVLGNVDPALNNPGRIRARLEAEVLPQLADRYGVEFAFGGRQADEERTLGDMRFGALLALALIYLVLAWVFGSYGWPLLVMFVIPFGIVGAIWGHAAMGQDITVLSLFGFFALSGIVVNDSIILVVFYKQLRARGLAVRDAVIDAACLRLRAVLLTSLTTIAGLSPLLFETSLQAQFLIPMATTIAFGLAFATLLVLLVIPSLLLIYENTLARFSNTVAAPGADQPPAPAPA